jgi:GNAT superfamily N-acetyltransferase
LNKEIIIRWATENDIPDMMSLIRELALFEKAPNEVVNTEARMLQEGFGDNPLFKAYVAEQNGVIVGLSIFYYRYSTWKGKCLYLEDLIITESERGKGIGTLLFEKTLAYAKDDGCTKMNWQVLDWNTPAIDFYKKYGSVFEDEWLNTSLELN